MKGITKGEQKLFFYLPCPANSECVTALHQSFSIPICSLFHLEEPFGALPSLDLGLSLPHTAYKWDFDHTRSLGMFFFLFLSQSVSEQARSSPPSSCAEKRRWRSRKREGSDVASRRCGKGEREKREKRQKGPV